MFKYSCSGNYVLLFVVDALVEFLDMRGGERHRAVLLDSLLHLLINFAESNTEVFGDARLNSGE